MKYNFSKSDILKEATKLKLFLAIFLVTSISFLAYSNTITTKAAVGSSYNIQGTSGGTVMGSYHGVWATQSTASSDTETTRTINYSAHGTLSSTLSSSHTFSYTITVAKAADSTHLAPSSYSNTSFSGTVTLAANQKEKDTPSHNFTASCPRYCNDYNTQTKVSVKVGVNGPSTMTGSYSVPGRTSYTINYEANGGTGGPSDNAIGSCSGTMYSAGSTTACTSKTHGKKHGYDITLSSSTPTRDNYTFTGWNTASNGSGTSYAIGATYSANANLTIYAQWSPKIYSITLNKNSGSGGTSTIYEKYNTGYYTNSTATTQMTTSTNQITVPTRSGYKFEGYYTGSGGTGTQYINASGYLTSSASSTNFTSSGTLYARWTYNATPSLSTSGCNTLTFSATGASAYYVSTSSSTPAAGSSAASSSFALNTWTTATSGTITSAGTYYVWAKDATTGGNVSSNKASKAAYTVSRSQGTGTTLTTRCNSTSSSTGTAFTSSQIVLAGLSVWARATANTGYESVTLKHGSTAMTASGSSYTVSASETVASTASQKILTITLDNQSATTAGTTAIYEKYASGYYLNAAATTQMTTSANGITVPTKTGYVFGGYYTGTSESGTQYIGTNGRITSSASNTNFSANGTLYANWIPNKVTLTIKKDGSNCTNCNGYKIDISTSASEDTPISSGTGTTTTASTLAISGAMSTSSTYYVWVGKDSNHQSSMAYSGVSFTGASAATATINFYTVTISRSNATMTFNGTSMSNGGTVVALGTPTSNKIHTLQGWASSGYTFTGWSSSTTSSAIESTTTTPTTMNVGATTTLTVISTQNSATITIKKDGNAWSDSGIRISLSTSSESDDYADMWQSVTSGSTATFNGIPTGTGYYIFAGESNAGPSNMTYTGYTISGGLNQTRDINYYTITRSQGTGTTLTTKWGSSSGMPFTDNPIVLGNNMVTIFASAYANTGYNSISLKHGTTTMPDGGDTFTVNATETISSTATPIVYTITLDNQGADSGHTGTAAIYEKYATGYYLESACTNQMTTSTNGITIPTKTGYTFDGYYTAASGGTQYIDASGKLTSNASTTYFTNSYSSKLYAHWSRAKLTITETVKGNQADATKAFSFTINLKDASNNNVSGTFDSSASGGLTFNSSGNATFTLKHGESYYVYLPTGYKYTITQTTDGYTLIKTNDSGTITTDTTATFTDTLSSSTPTGLFLDILPYIILVVGSLGSVFLVSKFRSI